jgi:hypothetical protein
MTNSPKNFQEICRDLEVELSDLAGLGAVMETCLDGGDISLAQGHDTCKIRAREAAAIRWVGHELAFKLDALFKNFLADYQDALQANLTAQGEKA